MGYTCSSLYSAVTLANTEGSSRISAIKGEAMMESSVGHRLTVTHRADVGVPCCVFCRTGPWRCSLMLRSADSMDGPRSWLGWLPIVGPLVAVNVDRCLDMKY